MTPGRAARLHVGAPGGRWFVLASALGVAALAFVLPGVEEEQGPPPASGSTEGPSSSPKRAVHFVPAKLASPAVPERIQIPALGVHATVIGLGLEPDRTVEVPADADEAGWFDLGPQPGTPGSAVILGHVDSEAGPAVFHDLAELVRGDAIRVRLSDGSTARFKVTALRTYANEDFPAQQVYAGSARRATLNLVTCGGEYDPDKGGYQSNVVAFARHTSTTR